MLCVDIRRYWQEAKRSFVVGTEENKALVWRAVDEVWNKKNIAVFEEYYAMGKVQEEWKRWISDELWAAFPDIGRCAHNRDNCRHDHSQRTRVQVESLW